MKKSKLLVTSLFILTMTSCSNLWFNPQNSTNPSISHTTSENKDDTSLDSDLDSSKDSFESSSVSSNVITPDDIEYTTEGNELTITWYKGSKFDIEIPKTMDINGTTYIVTGIGEKAFYRWIRLGSVKIPDSVKSIGKEAFYECVSLTSMEIPSSVEFIGDKAFQKCNFLRKMVVREGEKTIGASVFKDCTRLEELTLPFMDTFLGYYFGSARYDESYIFVPNTLKTVKILGGISIAPYAFYYCPSLTKIEIPNSITNIGACAFHQCLSITSFDISWGINLFIHL